MAKYVPEILTLCGVALGSYLTILKEREARESARLQKQKEKRNDFQGKTLMDLQEALYSLLSVLGEVGQHRSKTQQWGADSITSELQQKVRQSEVRVNIHKVRLQDDGVRKLVLDIVTLSGNAQSAASESVFNEYMNASVARFDQANERIGQVLRSLD